MSNTNNPKISIGGKEILPMPNVYGYDPSTFNYDEDSPSNLIESLLRDIENMASFQTTDPAATKKIEISLVDGFTPRVVLYTHSGNTYITEYPQLPDLIRFLIMIWKETFKRFSVLKNAMDVVDKEAQERFTGYTKIFTDLESKVNFAK